jgi:hypothetical protein
VFLFVALAVQKNSGPESLSKDCSRDLQQKRSINIEKLLKTNLISINRPPTENILPFQTLNRFFGTFFYLSLPSALGPFEFIEFLRNQILKIDGPLNGAAFLWFLETRNSIF